jgi:hypothetical protein
VIELIPEIFLVEEEYEPETDHPHKELYQELFHSQIEGLQEIKQESLYKTPHQ